MKMFVAPVVAWEISEPPKIPRGVVALLGRWLDEPHVVMPVNWPPVMLSTWPWTKFDHGEQRKKTPPAASSGVPVRPSGISIERHPAHLVGDAELDLLRRRSPSGSSSTLDAVSRVSIQPNATALTLILNWPHSLASVLVRPTTAGLARGVVRLARVAHRARDRGDVDDLAEDLAALLALHLGRLAQVRRRGADHAERDDRVDVEHPLERLVGHLVDRRVDRVARVVDDDVDLAPGVDRRLHERVGRARLRQVAGVDDRLARDLRRGLLGDVAVEVVDHDLRAVLAPAAPPSRGRCRAPIR